MTHWKLLAALPLLAGAVWAAPSEANDLAMPEKVFPALDGILKSAVNQSPRMVDRALDLEMAENDRVAARAALLPSASGYFRGYESRDRRADVVGDLHVKKVYYDLSVTQPIFFWGEKENTAKMGQIRQKITEGNYREAYRLLAQDLRSRYLALITLKVVAERARFNQKFSQDQLALAEERLKNKVISDLEIFPIRLAAERADIEVEHSAFDLENSIQALSRLSGAPPVAVESIPDAIPPQAYSADAVDKLLNAYVSQTDLPTAEAATLRRQVALQDLDLKIQKVRMRPKFSLAAGISQDEQAYTLNTASKYQVNSLYGGVQITWSLFDGFASRSAVRSSLARKRELENDYKDTSARLVAEAKTESRQIYFAARAMLIDDRFLTSSDGYVHTREDEFKRGVASEAEVSQARLSAYDARIASFRSRSDYIARVGEFLGLLDEDPALDNARAN